MKLAVCLVLGIIVPSALAAECACNYNNQHWMGTMTIKEGSKTRSGPFHANFKIHYFKATLKGVDGSSYIFTNTSHHVVCYEEDSKRCALDEERPFRFPECVPQEATLKQDFGEDEEIDCESDVYQIGKESAANYARYEVTVLDDGTCKPKVFNGRDSRSSKLLVTYSDISIFTNARGRNFYYKELKPFHDNGLENIIIG